MTSGSDHDAAPVRLHIEAVRWPDDAERVANFLLANEWPFHGAPRLSPAAASAVRVAGDDVASFWICEGEEAVGLIRLLDLDDVEDGSPMFDLRIAEAHRGRGVGRGAVDWLTEHLFTSHPTLHRIEATTRHDNRSMQTVFERCGYRCEGRFVEAWKNADGTRYDALVYAILRREWSARGVGVSQPVEIHLTK